MELNKWILDITHWCPAQIFYYFKDNDGGNWLIYLRWDGHRGDEPWSAELLRCDENWNFIWGSPDNINLPKGTEHIPDTVNGKYKMDYHSFLEETTLERESSLLSSENFKQNNDVQEFNKSRIGNNNLCFFSPNSYLSLWR